jgi:VWFA-related protein
MPPVFRRAVALVVLALATPGAQQREAGTESQQPTFRAGVNVVRVDVSVTGRNDEAIETLDASSFRVSEDGVPQKVETAQFIRLTGEPDSSGRDLKVRDRQHGIAEAEKDDVRLFALFLDDYHIDSHPEVAQRLKRALESFVDALRPTDLVVVMDPLTMLDGLTFTRDKWLLRERIRTFKGRRGELVPVRSVIEEAQLSQRNVWELRAGVTLSALEALVTHLGGLREGRKSVIFVSQGPPVGRPGSLVYPQLESTLRAANRGNVTVHVLDPRPLGAAPFGGAEALARLSLDTGGRAIVNSNTPWDRLTQVFSDASAYYLIGYTPARERADGKFHRIDVRVTGPGLRVTAAAVTGHHRLVTSASHQRRHRTRRSAAPSHPSCRSIRGARSTCGSAVPRQPIGRRSSSHGRPSAPLGRVARRRSRSSRCRWEAAPRSALPRRSRPPPPARRQSPAFCSCPARCP